MSDPDNTHGKQWSLNIGTVVIWGLASAVLMCILLPIVAFVRDEQAQVDGWVIPSAIFVGLINAGYWLFKEKPSKPLRFFGWCMVIVFSIVITGSFMIVNRLIDTSLSTSFVIVASFLSSLPVSYSNIADIRTLFSPKKKA